MTTVRATCKECGGHDFRIQTVFAQQPSQDSQADESATNAIERKQLDFLLKLQARTLDEVTALRRRLAAEKKTLEKAIASPQDGYQAAVIEEAERLMAEARETNDPFAPPENEPEVLRAAEQNVGDIYEYMLSLEDRLRTIGSRFDEGVTKLWQKFSRDADHAFWPKLVAARAWGRQIENDSAAIVHCSKCGAIVGTVPNPTSSRFGDMLDAVVAQQLQTQEIAEAVQHISKQAANMQKTVVEELNRIAEILAAPRFSTGTGMMFPIDGGGDSSE